MSGMKHEQVKLGVYEIWGGAVILSTKSDVSKDTYRKEMSMLGNATPTVWSCQIKLIS